MSGHAAPPKAAPAAGGGDGHSVGRPVRDLAAEIFVQLVSKAYSQIRFEKGAAMTGLPSEQLIKGAAS